MANVAIHRDNEEKPVPFALSEPRRDSFRMMRDLLNWDPFREMAPFAYQPSVTLSPAFEIKETKDSYLFKADVPGIKESDLEVTMTGNRLTVSGKREAEAHDEKDTFYAYERTYGHFTRSFTLPEGADPQGVAADLRHGVLTLTVKKTPATLPRKISVQVGSQKS